MSAFSDKMIAGLEEIGGLAMNIEMMALDGRLSADVKQELVTIATTLGQRTDELRTLARTIP